MKCHLKFQRFHFFWILLQACNRAELNNVEWCISSFATILKCKFIGQIFMFFFPWRNSPSWLRASVIVEASHLHSGIKHSVGLFRTSDNPVAETSTWQHTSLTRYRHAPWWDSNPKHYKASDRRTTP